MLELDLKYIGPEEERKIYMEELENALKDFLELKETLKCNKNAVFEHEMVMTCAEKYVFSYMVPWQMQYYAGVKQEIERKKNDLFNTFLKSIDVLAEYERRCGLEPRWRDALGNDRKMIENFACMLVCSGILKK